MGWQGAAAIIGALAAAGSAVHTMTQGRPDQPQAPAQPKAENVDATATQAALDKRRRLAGGGVASTVLSQTTASGTGGGKQLLGN